MGKKEFIGLRIEENLQKNIMEIVNDSEEFSSITELATKALNQFIGEFHENSMEHSMGHPFYPELVKMVGSLDDKIQKDFAYKLISKAKYKEIPCLFNSFKRHLFTENSEKL